MTVVEKGEHMFEATLLDHPLTFGHIVSPQAHAHRDVTRDGWLRAAESLLMTCRWHRRGIRAGRGYEITSAVLAVMALHTPRHGLRLDGPPRHAWCATRLWQIREQYRACCRIFPTARSISKQDARDGTI
jgi:hypothetical protein